MRSPAVDGSLLPAAGHSSGGLSSGGLCSDQLDGQGRQPLPLSARGALETLRTLPRLFSGCLKPGYDEPFVRFTLRGVETFVLFEPELIRHCFIRNAGNYEQSPTRLRYVRPIFGDSLMTDSNAAARQLRKAVAGVFTPPRMRGYCEVMATRTGEELRDFAKGLMTSGHSQPVRLADLAARITLSNLSAALFSGAFDDCLDELLDAANRLYDSYKPRDLQEDDAAALYIPAIDRPARDKAAGDLRTIARKAVERRIREGVQDDDLLDRLIAADADAADGAPLVPGEGCRLDRVVDNVVSFLVAGHETTASTVSWTLYQLTCDRAAAARAIAEADRVLSRKAPPRDWLASAPWIAACVQEALRLFPIVPILAREAQQDDTLAGVTVPAGSVVMIAARLLHRQHRHYPRPEKFDPARFLPQNRSAIDRMTWLPFAIGPRNCIGAAFGMLESVIVTASILSRFDFDYAADAPPSTEMRVICRSGNGIPMVLRPRGG